MTRVYEIIPGFLTWITLLSPFVLSIFKPTWVAYFIICFDLYWLYKAFLMGGHLISGYSHFKKDIQIDWLTKVKTLGNLENYIRKIKKEMRYKKRLARKSLFEELENALELKKRERTLKNWRDLYQAVILPTYKEELPILRASVLACKKAKWPKERMIIVLATEERDKERARKNAKAMSLEFDKTFFKFLVTEHPKDLPGELKAKGANVTWAAKKLQKFLDKKKISYENVVVSTFDADTRAHPQYFACLAYKYLTNPNRTRRSYQPIPLYSNNIWQVPALSRLVAFSASFWQLIEATRSYRMINFSSQSMSMQTLVEINFWDKTIISEDSRQYYRAYFTYQGDHQVVPIFVPVYMDAVLGENFKETLKEQYLQKKRWAWGVEHFPYLLKELPKHKEIPFLSKFLLLFRLFEGHYSWATASLLLALIGWLPFALNPLFRSTVLAYNLPYIARYLLGLTWIGLFISTYVSIGLLPKKPKEYGFWKTVGMRFQWALVPVTAIFFGSIPAIDAQTRMMLGRYLGFWVTKKKFVDQK